jgi:ElaB/YqjD/DUF883 family membrane-anchored ribosome-binding protein
MTTIAGTAGTQDGASDAEVLKRKAAAAKDAVIDLASEAKHFAAHRASGFVEGAKEKVSNVNDNFVDYVQRNPFTAIGIAVGVGFVAGLLLKRR